MEIKRILAPTDLSNLSATGVEFAAEIASRLGAELIVWHALRTEDYTALARLLQGGPEPSKISQQLLQLKDRHVEMLHEFASRHAGKFAIPAFKEVVELADPQDAIADWAKANGVDLIVMSTHGRSGVRRALLGSVTETVLRQAPCPVLAVPVHKT
jgi:nucleotide-binding universal stress UspA family protein